jgi:hypothetical protein
MIYTGSLAGVANLLTSGTSISNIRAVIFSRAGLDGEPATCAAHTEESFSDSHFLAPTHTSGCRLLAARPLNFSLPRQRLFANPKPTCSAPKQFACQAIRLSEKRSRLSNCAQKLRADLVHTDVLSTKITQRIFPDLWPTALADTFCSAAALHLKSQKRSYQ